MSLSLDLGTKPVGLLVKTWGFGPDDPVRIGEYEVSMPDFVEMVKYVLTNTNLQPDDPRFALVAWVKQLRFAAGFSGKSARYVSGASPAPAAGGEEGRE